MQSSRFTDAYAKGTWFEATVEDHGIRTVITTDKLPGWRKVHREIADRSRHRVLWITHIAHESDVGKKDCVTTTWIEG